MECVLVNLGCCNKYHRLHGLSGLTGIESACQAGDVGLIPGPRRSAGEGSDNPLQYSWLGNTKDRGAWWATVDGVANSWTRLSD